MVPCLQGSYQRSWDSNQARRSSVLRGLKEATEGEHRSGSVTGCCYATVVFLSMCMCTHIQHTRVPAVTYVNRRAFLVPDYPALRHRCVSSVLRWEPGFFKDPVPLAEVAVLAGCQFLACLIQELPVDSAFLHAVQLFVSSRQQTSPVRNLMRLF